MRTSSTILLRAQTTEADAGAGGGVLHTTCCRVTPPHPTCIARSRMASTAEGASAFAAAMAPRAPLLPTRSSACAACSTTSLAASSWMRLCAMSSRTDWCRCSFCLKATRSPERCREVAGAAGRPSVDSSTVAGAAAAEPHAQQPGPPYLHHQRQPPLAHADEPHAVVQAARAQPPLRNLKPSALACEAGQHRGGRCGVAA